MIYVLRLTSGECVVAMATDEDNAREQAMKLRLDETAEVATIRRLDHFAAQFTPTEDGSLAATHWDDATLDGILAHEYPLLYESLQCANAEPFLPAVNPAESVIWQLKAAYERNTDIIRQGLRQELHGNHLQESTDHALTRIRGGDCDRSAFGIWRGRNRDRDREV